MLELPELTPSPTVSINPQRVMLVLLVAAAALLGASLAGQVLKYVFNHDHVFGLVNLFNVDGEMNLPTWYSAVRCSSPPCCWRSSGGFGPSVSGATRVTGWGWRGSSST
jgi:hypothetical protein